MKKRRFLFNNLLKLLINYEKNDIHYIGGNDVLPPPLSIEEEKYLLENICESNSRNKLIEHNLRLVVYISKNLKIRV